MFSWQKPDPGVIKLNVDGSRVNNASGRIGAGEVLDPEIWGLYSGFRFLNSRCHTCHGPQSSWIGLLYMVVTEI